MSTLKIVPKEKSDLANDAVITRLTEALDMARRGELITIAICGMTSDGGIVSCWANNAQPFVMVGAIESLKMDYMMANIDG